MRRDYGDGSRASFARRFMALFAMLAMGLGLMARPAEAAPFAYVANTGSRPGTVTVIDTATNPPSVVATVAVGTIPAGVAVAPDGKHVYVSIDSSDNVSVIDTATNMVVATVALPLGSLPFAVAVTPDGKHVYVANGDVSVIDTATNTVVATVPVDDGSASGVAVTPDGKYAYVTNTNTNSNTVLVIDTAMNMVVATITVGGLPRGVAVTPDGKHVYVTNSDFRSNNVSVIDTASNKVVATIPVGNDPGGVAITPDGKHVYVANTHSNNVSVIDTASNTVVATVPVVVEPFGEPFGGVAITPDGKHVYVANSGSDNVSVIDTATNTVVATVGVGNGPVGVGTVPPPVGVPFLAFNAKLEIDLDRKPNKDRFELESSFTLSSTAPAINPVTDPVTLQIGTFATTISPGSFKKHKDDDEHGVFSFEGVIDGVRLEALIKRTGTLRYAFDAKARHANLAGTTNPVQVKLTIGGNSGTASVKADIDH